MGTMLRVSHSTEWWQVSLAVIAAALIATACQATGMGWIPSASLTDPSAKASFGFVYDDATQTFSGSYHDHALGVDFKGTGVLKAGPPPAGVSAKGGCLFGDPDYESQNAARPGSGSLSLTVCDLDGFGAVDFILINVTSGPYMDYFNSGVPSGNITVTSR
ncbi:MAG: hypothetical protein E6J24_09420 [Chloroflexi bacterium]|nr:MAG: hypothetical protein E6J24_09420 [Chloroflexota bacterium]